MVFFGQKQVYNQESQAVAGDRASQNPIATYDAGPGGLVAGPGGVTVGNFAWVAPPTDPNGTNQIANSTGGGNVAGFVYNDLQALDTIFLSDAGMIIPTGLPVALAVQGDFWVVNAGSTEATVGMKAYANFADGSISFAATGAPTAAATGTGSTVAAETNSWTGSIVGDVMTVTAVGGNTLYAGTTITGVGVLTGTMIQAQITPLLAGEVANGIGRYQLSVSQQKTISSESMTGTYGLFTVGTLTSATPFAVGQVLQTSPGSAAANTVITQSLTGNGGTGATMIVNNNTALSQTIVTYGNTETKWYAASAGGQNQLVKMTSWVGSQG